MEPLFNALPAALRDKGAPATVVARMDVDKHTAYAQRFAVRAFPTLLLFIDGVPVGQHVGGAGAEALLRYASATPAAAGSGAPESGASTSSSEPGLDLVLSARAQRGVLEELRSLRGELAARPDASTLLSRVDAITAVLSATLV